MGMYIYLVLFLLAMVGQGLDMYTTYKIPGKEVNAFSNWILSKIGMGGLAAVKLFGFAIVVPMLAVIFGGSHYGWFAGSCFAASAGGFGLWAGIGNLQAAKKAGIKVF